MFTYFTVSSQKRSAYLLPNSSRTSCHNGHTSFDLHIATLYKLTASKEIPFLKHGTSFLSRDVQRRDHIGREEDGRLGTVRKIDRCYRGVVRGLVAFWPHTAAIVALAHAKTAFPPNSEKKKVMNQRGY